MNPPIPRNLRNWPKADIPTLKATRGLTFRAITYQHCGLNSSVMVRGQSKRTRGKPHTFNSLLSSSGETPIPDLIFVGLGSVYAPGVYFDRLFSSLVINSNTAGPPLSIAFLALPIAGIISDGASILSAYAPSDFAKFV